MAAEPSPDGTSGPAPSNQQGGDGGGGDDEDAAESPEEQELSQQEIYEALTGGQQPTTEFRGNTEYGVLFFEVKRMDLEDRMDYLSKLPGQKTKIAKEGDLTGGDIKEVTNQQPGREGIGALRELVAEAFSHEDFGDEKTRVLVDKFSEDTLGRAVRTINNFSEQTAGITGFRQG